MLDLSAAKLAREGVDYRTLATLDQKIGSEVAIYYGVDAEAQIAYGSVSQPDGTSGLQPRDAFITDLRTQKMVRISDGRDRPAPTQFTGMTYAHGHVVWVETSSDNLSASDWVMYAYRIDGDHLGGGTTTELARAPEVGMNPVPMAAGSTIPRISGKTVYFTAVSDVTEKKVVTSIYAVPIDGSAPLKRVEKDVDGVFADDNWLYFARGRDSVMRRATSSRSAVEPVGAMNQIRSWCGGSYAHGLFVACANRAWTRALMVFDSSNRLLATIDLGKNDLGNNDVAMPTVDITEQLVAFDAGNTDEGSLKRYVFDVHDGSLTLLSNAEVNTTAHGSQRIQQLRLQPESGSAESFDFIELTSKD